MTTTDNVLYHEAENEMISGDFDLGKNEYLQLRKKQYHKLISLLNVLRKEEFKKAPYPSARGYLNKTIVHLLWTISRTEDIIVQSLIKEEERIFFAEGFDSAIGADIITTGDEIKGKNSSAFSKPLNIDDLYRYLKMVYYSTNRYIQMLEREELFEKFTMEDRNRLKNLHVVADDPSARWLIGFWCSQNLMALLRVPLGRQWNAAADACFKIKMKLLKERCNQPY